jgi:hypothetical protein
MAGYRRLHELRTLEEKLAPVRDAVSVAQLAEQIRSMTEIAQQIQTQRQALEVELDRFWTELETASSGRQGMRAGIDVSRVQAQGRAIRGAVDANRLEPLRNSVEAHERMLSVTEALIANGFRMLDALQSGRFADVATHKAEQEQLFRQAAQAIGAREVLEHVRAAWNESGVSPRTFRNLAARIGEVAARREIETRVNVAAGRRIEAQLRTQQILEGTLPGSTVTPAPTGTRVGAGLLALFEILRIGLEVAAQVREGQRAAAVESARQVQRGRNMVQWWVDRGVRPQIGLLDESDRPISLSQDQIWDALYGTPPPGIPANARAVVTAVAPDDRLRAIAILTVSCTTLNEWHRYVNDGASARERHGWTPFMKQDGRWYTLVFDTPANEYQVSFDQQIHDRLEALHARLAANQQSDLDMQTAGRTVQSVRNSAWVLGEDRFVFVFTQYGLHQINFGTARPRFVRVADPTTANRIDGAIAVKAADVATYARLRPYLWQSERQYWDGNGQIHNYLVPNEDGLALVAPGDLEPAPAEPGTPSRP